MTALWSFCRVLLKPLRDLASILYDDLEFKAMSLPRVAAAVLTSMIVWVISVWVSADRMFPGFSELCALTGGIWGAYLFKRRANPPEAGKCEGGELPQHDDNINGSQDGAQKSG